ncbi:hypothetical protein Micbo1qcDRAFT_64126 [Microdochium bolleyi]|uniref:Uncharacterized protein n=1 Tax=Microdochium bolleyi TaxID=196109 RepID=A0A136J2H1_9PEZI|nr:hypothetical protein Micbo1qcDRAFT_64126 [Microdochium bolleyi]
MTEPAASDQSMNAQEPGDPHALARSPETHPVEPRTTLPRFDPIFTLITNTSNASTHHPHVRYIFSDDDPDVFTQALAECEAGAVREGNDTRAMILDLRPDDQGSYSVTGATSLSPSWAVLNAEISQISPPSSDGGNNSDGKADSDTGDVSVKQPGRLMLRVEGVESSTMGSEVDLALSYEQSRQGSGSRSGIGSGVTSSRADVPPGNDNAEDYGVLIEDFQKRLTMLRKVVDAGEERRSSRAPTLTHESPEQHLVLQGQVEEKKPSG